MENVAIEVVCEFHPETMEEAHVCEHCKWVIDVGETGYRAERGRGQSSLWMHARCARGVGKKSPRRDKIHCNDRGRAILTLDEKIDALRYCMKEVDGPNEDAMGHLFDLINHIAPGYRFLRFDGIKAICDHYGSNPTEILP